METNSSLLKVIVKTSGRKTDPLKYTTNNTLSCSRVWDEAESSGGDIFDKFDEVLSISTSAIDPE